MEPRPITVCFPFIGDEIGGSHISAIKLVQALDTRRIRPVVALHVTEGPVADYLAECSVPFAAAPGGPFPTKGRISGSPSAGAALGFALRAALPLARFLRKAGVDLVHTNDGRMHACWALPAKLAGARHVWHHRGDPDALGVNRIAPFCASRIITVSRFSRPSRALVEVEHKLSVIHSPFERPSATGDRAGARAMLLDALGCAAETRFLGYFGLLIDRKRPVAFVEAVAAFTRACPDIPVMGLLFGVPGHEEPDLDRAVLQRAGELGIASRIRLMGFRRPVEPWMEAVDVLLVPAVREPFGRTLIEAMFLGTPVVATDDGGNPEAIEDGVNGFLVPPDRPESFVAPVHLLLTNAERRRGIVTAARTHAFASYGVDVHVTQVMAIYQSLCESRRRGAIHF